MLLVPLSNGAETTIILLSPEAAALPAGNYTVRFTLDRDRWTATAPGDLEQHYHDSWATPLGWSSSGESGTNPTSVAHAPLGCSYR